MTFQVRQLILSGFVTSRTLLCISSCSIPAILTGNSCLYVKKWPPQPRRQGFCFQHIAKWPCWSAGIRIWGVGHGLTRVMPGELHGGLCTSSASTISGLRPPGPLSYTSGPDPFSHMVRFRHQHHRISET